MPRFMKLEHAIEIVLDLARQGQLDEQEAAQDPDILEPEREKQETAINTVHDFFTNNVFK